MESQHGVCRFDVSTNHPRNCKFSVGGYEWEVLSLPFQVHWIKSDEHVSVCLQLLSDAPGKIVVFVHFSLVDQRGMVSKIGSKSDTFTYLHKNSIQGFGKFVHKSVLYSQNCIRNDHDIFTIQCDLQIIDTCVKGSTNEYSIPVLPSLLQHHLDHLFQSKAGADVTFKVKGKTLSAHRVILAARSSVFNAELLGSMRESKEDCIEIEDIEPDVFKALLRYIYTDMLHTEEGTDEDVMAQHLIVAADRYGLDRLRLICEDQLARKIGANNVVTTLALAARHNCQELKARCLDYMSSSPSDALISFIKTDIFASLLSYPSVYAELMEKVIAKK